jgi:hypothetical protein
MSQQDPNKMREELAGIIKKIPHPTLRALVESDSKEHGSRFYSRLQPLVCTMLIDMDYWNIL